MSNRLGQYTNSAFVGNRYRTWAAAALVSSTFLLGPVLAGAQTDGVAIRYDDATHVFRIDAAEITYVLGVNEHKQLQALYWGKRLAASDVFSQPKSASGAGFDLSTSVTPQDFVGWGGGLVVEPDLKINFPDGNRDLVLQYVSHRIVGDMLSIVMKDISREVYVTVEYQVDAETGILRRSASVENRTGAPFTIEQVAAGTWNLPPFFFFLSLFASFGRGYAK